MDDPELPLVSEEAIPPEKSGHRPHIFSLGSPARQVGDYPWLRDMVYDPPGDGIQQARYDMLAGWDRGAEISQDRYTTGQDIYDEVRRLAGSMPQQKKPAQVITAIQLVFGPCHGQHIIWTSMPLPDPMVALESYGDNVPMFTPYEFGEPAGPPRPSMMIQRHTYVLHDVFDQGTEVCAIYFHNENCCDKDYGKTEAFRDFNRTNKRKEEPRPSIKRPKRGDIY